jgi:hypothetical protein
MNIMTIVLVVIAGLIFLILLIALFTKKAYSIERQITINKPSYVVFDFVKQLKNQDKFSKWASMDPEMKKEYRGVDGTVGFVSAWDSENKKVGKGEQRIKKITEGESIDYDLHFIKPFEGLADVSMYTESISPNQTNVKWRINSSMKYPMNLMLLVMNMEKIIGADLSAGLNNLKNILET